MCVTPGSKLILALIYIRGSDVIAKQTVSRGNDINLKLMDNLTQQVILFNLNGL